MGLEGLPADCFVTICMHLDCVDDIVVLAGTCATVHTSILSLLSSPSFSSAWVSTHIGNDAATSFQNILQLRVALKRALSLLGWCGSACLQASAINKSVNGNEATSDDPAGLAPALVSVGADAILRRTVRKSLQKTGGGGAFLSSLSKNVQNYFKGARVNILHQACATGQSHCVTVLLQELSKQDCARLLRAENGWLRTPLMLAAMQGHANTVQAILNSNSLKDNELAVELFQGGDEDGSTIFHLAVSSALVMYGLLRFLVSSSCFRHEESGVVSLQPYLCSSYEHGLSVLHLCAEKPAVLNVCVEAMREQGDLSGIDTPTEHNSWGRTHPGSTPLLLACAPFGAKHVPHMPGHIPSSTSAQTLLRAGASFMTANAKGDHPLGLLALQPKVDWEATFLAAREGKADDVETIMTALTAVELRLEESDAKGNVATARETAKKIFCR